eukprot:gene3806-4736_t
MKFLYLLFIYFFSITIVYSQVFTNTDNQHTYEIKPGKKSWTDAASDANTNGGYLATITTMKEYLFIHQNLLVGTNKDKKFWIGSYGVIENGQMNYYWKQGPENDLLMYSKETGKCYSFCYWGTYGPTATLDSTTSEYNKYVYLNATFYLDGQNEVNDMDGYILEKNPLDKPKETEPVFIPNDTDDDTAFFKIPNLENQYKLSTLQIKFTSLNGDQNFTCKYKRSDDHTYTCSRPEMSGYYNIELNDPSNPSNNFIIKNAHPRGNIITINGHNFGAIESNIVISYIPIGRCYVQNFIVPHRSLTCSLEYPLSNLDTLLLIISVNQIMFIPGRSFSLYNPDTKNMIQLPVSKYSDSALTKYYVEGRKLEWFTPAKPSDSIMLEHWAPTRYCIKSVNPTRGTYLVPSGPNEGLTMIFLTPSRSCFTIPGCTGVDASVLSSTPYPLAYDMFSGIFYGETSIPTCYFAFNAYFNQGEVPYFNSTATYLVSTEGGDIFIEVENLGQTSSVYEVNVGGVALTMEKKPVPHYYPFVQKNSLKISVPPMIGSGIPQTLEIVVDSAKTPSSLNPNRLGYYAPLPQKFYPSTNISTLGGDLIELEGAFFSKLIQDMKVVIILQNGRPNISIPPTQNIIPYKKISFQFPRGTGTFKIFLNVGGQQSLYFLSGSYASPIISPSTTIRYSLANQETFLDLYGSNFGNGSYVTLMVNGKDVNAQITNIDQISESFYTFKLPNVLSKGTVQLNVDTLLSNEVSFLLSPLLFRVSPLPVQGGILTITGRYLKDTNVVKVGPNSYTNGIRVSEDYQQITIPIPPGYGLKIPTTINNGLESGQVMFNYGPFISKCTIDGPKNVISISGSGFDTDSKIVFGSSSPIHINIVYNQNLIVFGIPNQQNFNTSIISNTIKSNECFTTNIAPIISTYSQTSHDILEIIGESFGENINDLVVSLNSIQLNCQLVLPQTKLQCKLLPTSSSGPLTVSVSGLKDTEDVTLKPYIISMVPSPSNSSSIKIQVWIFGDPVNLSATIGTTKCTSVLIINATQIECTLPLVSDINTSPTTPIIWVSCNSLSSVNSIPFAYTKPSITSIIQNFVSITISGNTFGNNEKKPAVFLSLDNGGPTVVLGCTISQQQTELRCELWPNSKDGVITIANYLGQDSYTIQINPVLKSIVNYPPTIGGVISFQTAFIYDYLSSPLPPDTSIDIKSSLFVPSSYKCTDISVDNLSQQTIKCLVPSLIPTNSPVTLTINGRTSKPITFNYDIPKPKLDYKQTNQYTLEINGINFGFLTVNTITLENNAGPTNCILFNDSFIECNFESSIETIKNGPATISRNGIKSNPFRLSLEPNINQISNAPVD